MTSERRSTRAIRLPFQPMRLMAGSRDNFADQSKLRSIPIHRNRKHSSDLLDSPGL